MTSRRASTTSRPPCRFRLPSSSNTSSPPVTSRSKALGKRDARAQGWTFRAAPGNQLTHVPGLPLGTRGGILANVDLPADGEYHINIADMATHIWGNGMEYENPLVVTLDNKIVYQTVIGGEEDMKLYDQVQSGALDRVNARLKNIKFQATAGPAQDRRHVPAPEFRRIRRSVADIHARRRAGSFLPRELVPASGPLRCEGPQLHAQPRPHPHLQPGEGQNQNAGSLREGDLLDAGEARLSPSRDQRRHRGAHAVLRRWREARRFRVRHSRRCHGNAGEPVLPVSRRARPRGAEAGRQVRDHGSRTRVEAFVLPVELDSRRRTAGSRHQEQTQRSGDARQAGPAHAGRSAIEDAGEQFRVPVARHDAARRDRSGHRRLPVCLRPHGPAPGFPHRADAVCRQHLPGRPQRRGFAARQPYVPE